MDRRVAMSVAVVAAYAAAVIALSCAVSTGMRRGFSSYISTFLIILAALLFSISVYTLYRLSCKGEDHEPEGYYVTARLEPPGIDSGDITIADDINLRSCRVLETTTGQELRIMPGSYVVHAGELPRYRLRSRNSVAFKVNFNNPVDEIYFRLVIDRKLSTSAMLGGNLNNISTAEIIGRIIAVEPHDEYLLFSMQADFQEHMAEYLLYSMATSEKLCSGEGIKFYRFFCYCCMGMTYPPSPDQEKLSNAESDSIFSEFPGVWFAVRNYKQVFLSVIEFSRTACRDTTTSHVNTLRYLNEIEIIFLEKLIARVDTYLVSKEERVLAERSLTHLLVMMYAVTAPAKSRVFYREDLKSWLYGIMMDDMGKRESAMHVAMSSFGHHRFRGTLLREVYADLCSESGSRLKAMRSHMTDFTTLAFDNATVEQVSDVVKRKGYEFLALCSVMIPYFYKTKAHKTLLLTKEDYTNALVSMRAGMRNFNGTLISPLKDGTMLSVLGYHSGARPFTSNAADSLSEYITKKGKKVYCMLERLQDLEHMCDCSEWKDSSILKFFVQLAIWMWDTKELCLLRKKNPLKEKTCSVASLFSLYIHEYWGHIGTDVLMRKEDYYTLPVKTMFSDSIRIDFRASPCEETLQVSRGVLNDIVCMCMYNHGMERVTSSA